MNAHRLAQTIAGKTVVALVAILTVLPTVLVPVSTAYAALELPQIPGEEQIQIEITTDKKSYELHDQITFTATMSEPLPKSHRIRIFLNTSRNEVTDSMVFDEQTRTRLGYQTPPIEQEGTQTFFIRIEDQLRGVVVAEARKSVAVRESVPNVEITTDVNRYTIFEQVTFRIEGIAAFVEERRIKASFPYFGNDVTNRLHTREGEDGVYFLTTEPLSRLGEHTLRLLLITEDRRRILSNIEYTVVAELLDASIRPTLDLVFPDTATFFSYQGNREMPISFTFADEDDDLNIESFSAFVGGQEITEELTIEHGEANGTLAGVPSGQLTIGASIEDFSGLDAVVKKRVEHIADEKRPIIKVISHENNALVNEQVITVAGIIEEAHLDVLTVNEEEVTPNEDGVFTKTIAIEEGTNTINIFARDKANWETTKTIQLIGDFNPPSLIITSPQDQEVVSCDAVLRGESDDETANIHILLQNPWNEEYRQREGNGYEQRYNNIEINQEGQFLQVIELISGQHIVQVTAQDNAGNETVQTIQLTCDQQAPTITINSPRADESVYNQTAEVHVQYDDFLSEINQESVQIIVEDQHQNDVTEQLTFNVNGDNAETTGTITGFTEEQSYTIRFTVEDEWGNSATEEVMVYIAPGEMTPPEALQDSGMIYGQVVDASTCDEFMNNCVGLAGAMVTLAFAGETKSGQLVIEPEQIQGEVITGPNGKFSFPTPETDAYWLRVVKDGFTYAQREIESTNQKEAALGVIHLSPTMPASLFHDANNNGVMDEGEEMDMITEDGGMAMTQGTQADGTEWEIMVEFPEGALEEGEELEEVNLTWFEQVEFLPSGELPPGTEETIAFDLSGTDPNEHMEFNEPVRVQFANTRGFSTFFPNTNELMTIPVGYWNDETMNWEHVGLASAVDTDEDGTADYFEFETTHFSPFDCNDPVTEPEGDFDSTSGGGGGSGTGGGTGGGGGPDGGGAGGDPVSDPSGSGDGGSGTPGSPGGGDPGPDGDTPRSPTGNEGNGGREEADAGGPCAADAGNSIVSYDNCELTQTYELPSEQFLGRSRTMQLVYSSINADPTEVIASDVTLQGDIIGEFTNLEWQLTVAGEVKERLYFEEPEDNTYRFQYLFDGRDPLGRKLHSGVYPIRVATDANFRGQYYWSTNGRFGGPPDLNRPTGVFVDSTHRRGFVDYIGIHNLSDSPFGSGWTLQGMQQLHESEDGHILITDGQAKDLFYFPNKDKLPSLNERNGIIENPAVVVTNVGDTNLEGDVSFFNHEKVLTVGATDINIGEDASEMVFSPDGRYIYALNNEQATINIIHRLDEEVIATIAVAENPTRIALAPDETELYVLHSSEEGRVSIINLETQEVEQTTIPVGRFPNSLFIDTAGTSLYVASAHESEVKIINTATRGVSSTIDNVNSVGDIAEDPNSNVIYLGNNDRDFVELVRVNKTTRQEEGERIRLTTREGRTFESKATQIFFHPVREEIYVRDYPGRYMHVVDKAEGVLETSVRRNIRRSTAVMDPAGQYIYTVQEGPFGVRDTLLRFNTDTRAYDNFFRVTAGFGAEHIIMDANNQVVYIANSRSASVSMIDVANETKIRDMMMAPKPKALYLAPGGQKIYTRNEESGGIGIIDLGDPTSYVEQTTLDVPGGRGSGFPYFKANDPLNRYAYVGSYSTGRVAIIDFQTGEKIADIRNFGSIQGMVAGPDGEFLYVGYAKRINNVLEYRVGVIDIEQQREVGFVQIPNIGTSFNNGNIIVDPDSLYVYVVGQGQNSDEIYVVNTETLTHEQTIEMRANVQDMALAVSGEHLYVANSNGDQRFISLIDLQRRVLVRDVRVFAATHLAVHPDGTYVYGATNEDLTVLHTGLLQEVATTTVSGVGGGIRTLGITPNGRKVYAAGKDSVVMMDTETFETESLRFSRGTYQASPTELDITPDSRYVYVTDGRNNSVVIIDTESNEIRSHVAVGPDPSHVIIQGTVNLPPLFNVLNLSESDQSKVTFNTDSESEEYKTYTREYPNGSRVHFTENGLHDYTIDRIGNRTDYIYEHSVLQQITQTAAGEDEPALTWTFEYENGNIARIINSSGARTALDINEEGHLRSIENTQQGVRGYTYDEQNHILSKTLENGDVFSYVYNEYGRLIQATSPERETILEDGTIVSMQENREFVPAATRELLNELIDNEQEEDRNNPSVLIARDEFTSVASYPNGDVTYETNKFGSITKQIDSLNRELRHEYDRLNNRIKTIYPKGDCTEYEYNAAGQMTKSVHMGREACTLPQEQRDLTQAIINETTYEPFYQQIKTKTDPNGNTVTYRYDYEFDTNADGQFTAEDEEFDQFEAAYISQGSRFIGNRWQVVYPNVQVFNPETQQTNTSTPTMQFQYNLAGQVVQKEDEQGAITTYAYTDDGRGLLTEIVRDAGGEQMRTQFSDFDVFGKYQTRIDPNGNRTTYRYNQHNGLVESQTQIVDLDHDGQDETVEIRFLYDERNNLVQYTQDAGGPQETITEYTYNAHNQLTDAITTDSNDRSIPIRRVYDEERNLALQVDGNGNMIKQEYDSEEQLIRRIVGWSDARPDGIYQEAYEYDLNGNIKLIHYPNGATTKYIYDEHDRRIAEVQNSVENSNEADENITTTYQYDNAGLITAIMTPDGVITTYEYDAGNRLIREIQDAGEGRLHLETTYEYDIAGNKVKTTDPRGTLSIARYDIVNRQISLVEDVTENEEGENLAVTYQYDQNGNLKEVHMPNGSVTKHVYDALNRKVETIRDFTEDEQGHNARTQFFFDRLGNTTKVIDPNGKVTAMIYNGFGKPTRSIEDERGRNIITEYKYDNNLNLISFTDNHGNETTYTYDEMNRERTVVYPDTSTEETRYNDEGTVEEKITRAGDSIVHTYDKINRLKQIVLPDESRQVFAYDQMGRLTFAQDTGQETIVRKTYDALGNTRTDTQQIGQTENTVGYVFDYLAGTLTIRYPSGEEITRRTDALKRVSSISNQDAQVIASYQYNDEQNETTRQYANGIETTYQYDNLKRVREVSSSLGGYAYTYDEDQNRTAMERLHRDEGQYDVYTYDSSNQLRGVKYGATVDTYDDADIFSASSTYALDTLGNRTAVTHAGVETTYAPVEEEALTNRLNQYEAVGEDALVYDENGHIKNDRQNNYRFDELGRLVSVRSADDRITNYRYDPLNRRVQKETEGVITRYIYEGKNIIEEQDEHRVTTQLYVYGANTDEVIYTRQQQENEAYYYGHDALGSVTELSNSAGELVQAYEYDVYGEPRIFNTEERAEEIQIEQAIAQPFLFAGKEYDVETGNYYFRARTYSPRLGRFLSPDQKGYVDGGNLYAYVRNNPVSAFDANGNNITVGGSLYPAGLGGGVSVDLDIEQSDCCHNGTFIPDGNIRASATITAEAGIGLGGSLQVGLTVVDLQFKGPRVFMEVELAAQNTVCGGPINALTGCERKGVNFGANYSAGIGGFDIEAAVAVKGYVQTCATVNVSSGTVSGNMGFCGSYGGEVSYTAGYYTDDIVSLPGDTGCFTITTF